MPKNVCKTVVVLGPCPTEKYKVVGGQLILQLQLTSDKVQISHLYMMCTGKRQLRLKIMREPGTADERVTDIRNILAKEQTTIEQGLERQMM